MNFQIRPFFRRNVIDNSLFVQFVSLKMFVSYVGRGFKKWLIPFPANNSFVSARGTVDTAVTKSDYFWNTWHQIIWVARPSLGSKAKPFRGYIVKKKNQNSGTYSNTLKNKYSDEEWERKLLGKAWWSTTSLSFHLAIPMSYQWLDTRDCCFTLRLFAVFCHLFKV